MPVLRVVDENGEIREVEPDTRRVVIELDDGGTLEPAIVDRLEWDKEGGMSTTKYENCNKTEVRRESDEAAEIVIEGIITNDQLATIKSLKADPRPIISSELYSGAFATQRLTIEQTSDLVEYVPEGGEAELAFRFHLQITASEVSVTQAQETEPTFDSYQEYERWREADTDEEKRRILNS